MHRVNLLRHYGLKPILVFDGGLLPMKGEQENKRARYCMFPGFSISLGFFFFLKLKLLSILYVVTVLFCSLIYFHVKINKS